MKEIMQTTRGKHALFAAVMIVIIMTRIITLCLPALMGMFDTKTHVSARSHNADEAAAGECGWGSIELARLPEDNRYRNVGIELPETFIMEYGFLEEDILDKDSGMRIMRTIITEDRIAVTVNYAGSRKKTRRIINVYDLNGCFLYGIDLRVKRDSPFDCALPCDDGVLYYNNSSECIFRISADGVELYDAVDVSDEIIRKDETDWGIHPGAIIKENHWRDCYIVIETEDGRDIVIGHQED